MQNIKQSAIVLIVSLVILGGVNLIYAWTGPTANPPNNNVDAPINVGGTAQQKTGSLRVGGFTSDYATYLATLSGNVGIGITTPQSKLQIKGSSSYDSSLHIGLSNVNKMHISAGTDNAGTAQDLLINPAGGNVGIGLTSPSQKLDVNGYVKGTGLCIGSDCRTSWPSGGTGGISGSGTTNYISKWTGSTSLGNSIIFDNGSSVGIGTTNPGAKLEIRTTASLDGLKMSDNTRWMQFFSGTLCSGCYNPIAQSNDNGIIFTGGSINTGGFTIAPWASSASGIRITSSGNVGIGTANPGSKLTVGGNFSTNNRADIETVFGSGNTGINTNNLFAQYTVRANQLCLGGGETGNGLGTCKRGWPQPITCAASNASPTVTSYCPTGTSLIYWGMNYQKISEEKDATSVWTTDVIGNQTNNSITCRCADLDDVNYCYVGGVGLCQ